jgi:dienelactone hydrolase
MDAVMQSAETESSKPVTREGATRRARRRHALRPVLLLLLAVVVLLVRPASHHVRATSLLLAFSDEKAKPAVTEERTSFTTPEGRTVAARWYFPASRRRGETPGVVMVHGVHNKGIDEPRLERFARAVAGAGVAVMTPSVEELSDYHVSPRSIDTVGAAVGVLQSRLGGAKVGVMGMSFGGGIALLTAADARFADRVAFVVAIGAHDDLARVSRFFATSRIELPDGTTKDQHAHDYGAMVLVYTHVADFFPADDVPAASDAIRYWLSDERTLARKSAEVLSPASKAKMEKLFAADVPSVQGDLLGEVDRHAAEMAAVSPHGRLAGLRAHVYLLHGGGDSVIPASETLWLAKDVPPSTLRQVLVSPAIVHVELDKPSVRDQWDLVHFMSAIIAEAEASR